MKTIILVCLITFLSAAHATNETSAAKVQDELLPLASLNNHQWQHGSLDCEKSTTAAIETFQFDKSSYVLRQNKCSDFEAPFIYLFFGQEKILLVDTGAVEDSKTFPLYEMVAALIKSNSSNEKQQKRELLVIHTHSHSDHYSGDEQFKNKPNVSVIEPNFTAMSQYFGFDQLKNKWPTGDAQIELGERQVIIIPTPGHQEEAISIYDPQTKWLLTGDSLYPGLLYVKDWQAYKTSISRLVDFSRTHKIDYILGSHIEMSNHAGEFYSIGSTYQPDEVPLPLYVKDLISLNNQLKQYDESEELKFNKFIVRPMNFLQRSLSNIARLFTQ